LNPALDPQPGEGMRIWRMRRGISITVKPSDRKRLKAILQDRNAPQKHAWRAKIILLSAEGCQSALNFDPRSARNSDPCVRRDLAE
jgi:hypothetical protein